ncbi:MAG: hypothetical protein KGJ23_04210 [Euryarchaeota archaeon]|nr:hypothetical protein [Euryarchaeota archaeon]MDE1835803.1 hypothetical protein [Euryarchaeota archaeon]MDE1880723.1 hypothetical protein [Euryarchaeota archaeon]MDE2043994.1 hypothetical protein [Thermoplasmata archaeon]
MSRRSLQLAILLLLVPLFLLSSLSISALAGASYQGVGHFGLTLRANSSQNSSDPSSSAIPPVVCPLAPVNTSFGPVTCFQMLDLTEVFVILLGITITLYVYKDADKAELPGEASNPAVTGEDELEQRRQQDQEEAKRAEMEEQAP